MKNKISLSLLKCVSLILAAVLCISIPFTASAVFFGNDDVPGITDNEALKTHIKDSLLQLMKEWDSSTLPVIDISSFNIPKSTDNKNALNTIVTNVSPETYMNLGYVKAGSGRNYSVDLEVKVISETEKYYTKIKIKNKFLNSASEFKSRLDKCQKAADELLKGIKGSSFSDAEKALLVHDRIALLLKYDESKTASDNYNIYGALINNVCICDGYANAYRYLLAQLGINCTYCKSETLNHTWNIVTIGGKNYHVDITWDDPTTDISGRVNHDYFLKSTSYMTADSDHYAPDYSDNSPTDKTYDNWYMNSSAASAQIVNGTIYYVDNVSRQLKKVSGNTGVKVKDLGSKWSISTDICGKATTTFSRLATDGKYLYYAKTDGIYKYDPATDKEERIYSSSKTIAGFTYDGTAFDICIYNDGPYTNISFPYTPSDIPSGGEYTLTFISDGTKISEKVLKEGDTITKPANPVKEGYTFTGWNPSVPAKMPANNLTVTAVFVKNSDIDDVAKATISAPTGTKNIDWKYRAQLKATATGLPSGYSVAWYEGNNPVSGGKAEFTTENLTADHTYTAKIIDSSGNVVSTPSQEKTVTIKVTSDFFTKLISFFKRLFGSDIIVIK